MSKTVSIICDECGSAMSEDDNDFIEVANDYSTSKKGASFEIERRIASISVTDGVDYNVCAACRKAILSSVKNSDFKKKPTLKEIEQMVRDANIAKTATDPLAPR